jgi:2-polyprenyl-3-methyl-5-hydroxy-6-metoxy-1,4-benzoquinol methylase/glycosyltransferase involved in cell wall biosynthesis
VKFTIAFYVDSVPFGPGEIDGTRSLGGSESACLGLARALKARGHDVHVFATKLDPDCQGLDAWDVHWHRAEDLIALSRIFEWDVFCALRMPNPLHANIRARLRLLWSQDLMNSETFKNSIMSAAWAVDRFVYVSEFHRTQWQDWLPELTDFGYVTKNGFDPARVPESVTKRPERIIHISRPERGLAPILDMWPALKAKAPHAELHLCRYNSMYDAGPHGWASICAMFDRKVEKMNAEVGGISYLGELGKSALYQAIAEAAVMWYPGVPSFAETSCIAAVEAQANGTPFIGSYKGALPETVPEGVLVTGDAFDSEYQSVSVDAVVAMLDDCARNSVHYRRLQRLGREHVESYTYDAIAAEWDGWLVETFKQRYQANRLGVLHQLQHYDDYTAVKRVATEIVKDNSIPYDAPIRAEAAEAVAYADRVIAGKEQTAHDYAHNSLDPIYEMNIQGNGRLDVVVRLVEDCTHILDVACGNGAFALAMATKHPALKITAIDYAAANIEKAKAAADELGLSDRIEFICAPVWDFDRAGFSDWWQAFVTERGRAFDGLWCGEFIEHVADCTALIDGLETVLRPDAHVLVSCPNGPMMELVPRTMALQRGHVHHFAHDDLIAVFGQKKGVAFDFLGWQNQSPTGATCGNWIIVYRASDVPAGSRNYAHRIVTTRPKSRLSVGILACNSEHDLLRCIDSVWGVCDEIIVGDTGSSDSTKAIAASISRKVRVIDLPAVASHVDGFAGARNAVLKEATGDWFLWIDTDEVLAGAHALAKYLDSVVYKGFAMLQNHLQLDAPMHSDTPVRLFRRVPEIQFYGCVHEQPQWNDCNGDIVPSLQLQETQLAHTGYLVEGIRRDKMKNRNFPLLVRDRERFPTRKLGQVLVLRDLVNLADFAAEQHRGHYPPYALDYLKRAIGLFEAELMDPANRYHAIARPWYEKALKTLDLGTEVELAMAAKIGGLEGQRSKARRIWVRDPEHLKPLVAWQINEMVKVLTPAEVRVDPIETRQAVSA